MADPPNVHLPRRYQEEIFNRAQAGNVIAALDTGSGKTFISILLIRWITSIQLGPKEKVVIFLVPKVPLVEQQGDFIATQTPLRVCKLSGVVGFDMADRSGWKRRFQEHDVLVMTAQIFLNLLTHSHWSIDKVSLMIFDECHHARKNHPYNGIMREYFQVAPELRPKVFGMTASPIWNPKDAAGSLDNLEKNLDAKVIGVRQHAEELAGLAPRPTEVIKEYPTPPEVYNYPFPTLRECLDLFNTCTDVDIPWMNIQSRYFFTLENLGPYCAELYLYSDMKHRFAQLLSDPRGLGSQDLDMDAPELQTTTATQELVEMNDIVCEYAPFFDDPSVPISLLHCTPKVSGLVSIVLEHASSSTNRFQGIIFVEQRQVASCLAIILPRIPELKQCGIRCAELVGQGTDRVVGKGRGQGCVTEAFKDGEINLIIATSVAEEGLDFPACDLVVRFDSLQHMVGYVQSRGRARNKTSKFVVMVQKDHSANLAKYKTFMESEPELKRAYETREDLALAMDDEDDEEGDPNLTDTLERERYVVQSTGAVLTYDTSINLLNYLCSLLDASDPFTPVLTPEYSGDFSSTLVLPTSLPIPRSHLTYNGPLKRSKKEAKRAVAFMAVKRLRELNVFDDYLLPASNKKGHGNVDGDGQVIGDVSSIPEIMNVLVRDPWVIRDDGKLWVHAVWVDNRRTAGIVTGTSLPSVELHCAGVQVAMESGRELRLDSYAEGEMRQWDLMDEFTKLGIGYCNTGRPITGPLSCFLVPLGGDGDQPDFHAMERLVQKPLGSTDWDGITEQDYGRLMIINSNEIGHPLILHRIRQDLSPLSVPPPGSRECDAGFSTYKDYYTNKYHKWSRRGWNPNIFSDGPLLEAWKHPRRADGTYELNPPFTDPTHTVREDVVVPQSCCRWIDLSDNVYQTFHILPQLCHRITDIYRARRARIELSLPPIADDLLVEALTLPPAVAGWSNQRLETLGDSVLKMTVTVHLFNRYPYRHEGQLDIMRQNSVCNRTLLARAKQVGLERFLSCETQSLSTWRYTVSERTGRHAHRQFPRRNLQDCMEATLGAAFLTGGIPMALRTGEALGLAMGGVIPWSLKYSRKPEPTPISPLFAELQAALGYEFHQSTLLIEAVTHPSFASAIGSTSSYQRLEFLGDALIDLVVMKYLFDKFPESTSDQLSWPRSRVVSCPALSAIAVQKLGLHKLMLINSVDLSIAITNYIPLLSAASPDEIVNQNWKLDPPKPISDVFEAIMGAVLVDSVYNFEKAASVVEFVMGDVLAVLSPSLRRDPVTELLEWTAQCGCREVVFQKIEGRPEIQQMLGIAVLKHDILIAGPVFRASLPVAKNLAAERALATLRDKSSEKDLVCLCDCGVVSKRPQRSKVALQDKTNVGPAGIMTVGPGRRKCEKDDGDDIKAISDAAICSLQEEQEVRAMLLGSPSEP